MYSGHMKFSLVSLAWKLGLHPSTLAHLTPITSSLPKQVPQKPNEQHRCYFLLVDYCNMLLICIMDRWKSVEGLYVLRNFCYRMEGTNRDLKGYVLTSSLIHSLVPETLCQHTSLSYCPIGNNIFTSHDGPVDLPTILAKHTMD